MNDANNAGIEAGALAITLERRDKQIRASSGSTTIQRLHAKELPLVLAALRLLSTPNAPVELAGLLLRLRSRTNDAPMDHEHMMDEAIEALESQAKALSEHKVAYDGLMKAKETFRAEAHRNAARALAAEARLAELSRAMTEVRDWLILAGDMTCREIPLGIIARAQQESKDA